MVVVVWCGIAGVPSSTGAQLVLPPLPGVPNSTIYKGTFDNVKFMDYGKPSGFGTITYANGNVYQGPIQEGAGGSFMPVLMAGELLVRSEPGVPAEAQFDCTSLENYDVAYLGQMIVAEARLALQNQYPTKSIS